MRKTKLLFSILCTVITFSVAAENTFDFYSVTDFGYYPKSDVVSGGTHFAPVTGPYSGIEARETLKAVYTIPTPGNNFLTEGNKISFEGALALTPVSLTPKFSVSYTPVAFLNLSAGAEIGTGWEILGIKSMSCYDKEEAEYKQQDAFGTYFYKFWACPTVMFDLAAVWPGDWHHVVAVASWELNYSALAGADDDDELFQWETTPGKKAGAGISQNYILGYQMPYKLNLVGLKFNVDGYLFKNIDDQYRKYKIDYKTYSLAGVFSVQFTEKDSLFGLVEFRTRRSYEEFSKYHDDGESKYEPLMEYSGHEWYFQRVGFSYTHKF